MQEITKTQRQHVAALKKQTITDDDQDKAIWKIKIEMSKKVDAESFDEALEDIRSKPAGKGAIGKPGGRARKGDGGGLSTAEKNRLKEVFEKFDSIESNQKKVMQQVKSLNTQSIKDSLAAL